MKNNQSNIPFYDPDKTYEENFEFGPFGGFATGEKYVNKGEPTYDFLGEKVYLPFGIAAGPLVNGKFVKASLDKGFDLAVYKTVRTGKYVCHSWPNVVPVKIEEDLSFDQAQKGLTVDKENKNPTAITNSFGVPSSDPDFWQQDLADCVKYAQKGQVVIGSFQGTIKPDGTEDSYVHDFALAAKLVKDTGVKILEANLSCPNEGTAELLCFDVDKVVRIVDAVRNVIGNTPLILKMAYFHQEEKLRYFVEQLGNKVEGLSAINTIPAKIYNEDGTQALPGENRLISGVCGKPIQWAGLDMVKRLKNLRKEFGMNYSIIGVGGVMDPSDYKKFIESGADAVMCATGAMWNAHLSVEIKEVENI